jgi:hypothetical protein
MPNLSGFFYDVTKTCKTSQYIETGTYLGDGIRGVLHNYEHIHSIELSEKWYNHNVEQFKDNHNVTIHLGDSKKILGDLLSTIHEPVTLFLDAHYSGTPTAFGEEECPLLFELELLKNRQYDDIIIIDDCRLLGKTGECGCSPDHPVYPTMIYNWVDVTESKIIHLLKDGYVLLKNDNREYTDGPCDQYILAKKNNGDNYSV